MADHDKPAAGPASPPPAEADGWAELVRRGSVTLPKTTGKKYHYPVLPRILKGITSAELLDLDRGDR